MDRQIIFAIAVAVGTMLGFSGLFFGPKPPVGEQPRPQYAPEDIRHSLAQADAKKKKSKKSKKSKKPVKEEFASGTSSSGGDSNGDAGDDANQEPSAEEPEAEEPPIE